MINTPTAREAARQAVRSKLAGLAPGQTGINLADEVADAAYEAAHLILRDQYLTEAAGLIRDRNPDRCWDFSDGVEWAVAELLAARTNRETR